jgi:OOP family OmpA-OmpF porin
MAPSDRIDPKAGPEPPRRRDLRSAIARGRHSDDDLQALRQVLVGPEQVRIERVEVATTPAAIGNVLPEATAHAAEERGPEMSTALAKPLAPALRDVARREPELFTDILAPTIGVAVRKAVKEVIDAVLQRINQTLERAVSLRSVQWRIEARRTRTPLTEIVLAHTVLYRVEWVVLLHNETSLVLEHASLAETAARAPDELAAMLQAISSFVSDAFREATPGGALETMEVGDLSIWLERDPAFTLAAAIRGSAPPQLRDQLRATLAQVRTLHAGDVGMQLVKAERFADTEPLLAECLQQKLKPIPRRAQWILVIGAIAALLGGSLALAHSAQRKHARAEAAREDIALRTAYRETLDSTPGIVVTSIRRDDGKYVVEGLRDPRAREPLPLLSSAGLPAPKLELAPYSSLDPRLGSPFGAVGAAIRELEQLELRYPSAVSAIAASDPKIRHAAELIHIAQRGAAQMGESLCVEVVGDASPPGPPPLNKQLRSQRAEHAIDALVAAGVSREVLAPRAFAEPQGVQHQRRVSFRGELRADPRMGGCPP